MPFLGICHRLLCSSQGLSLSRPFHNPQLGVRFPVPMYTSWLLPVHSLGSLLLSRKEALVDLAPLVIPHLGFPLAPEAGCSGHVLEAPAASRHTKGSDVPGMLWCLRWSQCLF